MVKYKNGEIKNPQYGMTVLYCGLSCACKNVALCLLYLCNDGLEGLWVVDGEVSENLAVDFDTSLVECSHEL